MVVELVKTIKPAKLKIDEVRQNILKTMQVEGQAIAREFQKTTATWEGEKPTFDILADFDQGDAILLVGPGGSKKAANKWVWTDQGTKPHKIRAKNKPRLIFREGFSPKTLPGRLSSFPGGTFGPYASPVSVSHPGTKPRKWSQTVMRRRRKRFIKAMIDAAKVTP